MLATLHLVAVLLTTANPVVLRATVPAGQKTSLAMPAYDELIVVDPSVVNIRRTPKGLEVSGLRSGKTQLQVYRGNTLSLVLVSVDSPVSRAGGGSNTLLNGVGSRGPLTSFFGDNSFTSQVDLNSQVGVWNTSTLTAAGLINQGVYRADVKATFGALGQRLLHAQMNWAAKNSGEGLTLGDATLLSPTSRMFSAVPALGLDVGFGAPALRTRLFLGNLSTSAATAAAQPLFFGGVDGIVKPGDRSPLSVAHATSLMGFSDANSLLAPGRTGALLGERLRLDHAAGYAVEARGNVMLSSEKQAGGANDVGGELGFAVMHQNVSRRTARLSYDVNVGSVYNPVLQLVAPLTHRAAFAYGERFSKAIFGGTSLGYSAVTTGAVTTHAYSAGLSTQATFSARTQGFVQATQQGSFTGDGSAVDERMQRNVTVEARHTFDERRWGRAAVQYLENHSPTSVRHAIVTAVTARHRADDHWFVEGNASALGELSTSTLAVDQPPLTIQASAGANGGLIVNSANVVAGLMVQKVLTGPAAPTAPFGVSVNVGVQYAPTVAHRLAANFAMTEYLGVASRRVVMASVAYTFSFGDAVHAPSLVQVLVGAELTGLVCVDADADGQCAVDEAPIRDLTVTLSNGQTAVTDAKGRYRFTGLKLGYYGVEVDSQKLRALGQPTTPMHKSVQVAESRLLSESFGVRTGCEVRGRVTHDFDVTGAYSDGDGPVEGALVRATSHDGKTVDGTTDGYGGFRLSLPRCGTHSVEVLADRLPESTRVVTEPVQVQTVLGASAPPVTLSVSALRSLAGAVFLDANHNGRRDAGEQPVRGARVTWTRAGAPGGAANVGAEGNVLLRRLPSGAVKVQIEPLDPAQAEFEATAFDFQLPNGASQQSGVAFPVVPRNKS